MRHQGKRHGRGKGGAVKRRVTGFLQPCLLLQLCRQDQHGYELLQGLQEFMVDSDGLDPSIVYRIMRDMERKGFVDSYEGTVSRGPTRRMYRITPDGKIQLSCWIEELKKTREEINSLVALYRKQVLASEP